MREKIAIILTILFLFLLPVSECSAQKYRIVSLAPNITEILFTLGLGDSIVGVDGYSNYPEGVNNIERVGTFFNPNMERIILLKPDYIMMHAEMARGKSSYLKRSGVKIVEVSPNSVDEVCDSINMLGGIFGKEEKARLVVDDIKARINAVNNRRNGRKPKVFIQLFDDPLITVSSFIGDVIRLAGGDNIAWDVRDDAGIFSYEVLIDRDPDMVIIAGFSEKDSLPDCISAVKNNRVYRDLNLDVLLRPGPRAIDAVEELNRIFYEAD